MIDETRTVETEETEEITAVEMAWKYFLANKNKVRIAVQIAPAVRVAIGEAFGLDRGEDAMGKVVAALKLLGADVVVDGAIAEDLIAIAEAEELKARWEQGDALPVITSRCSAFVNYMRQTHPELMGYCMQSPSPMQALSMLIKKYYDKVDDGKVTKVIAIAPCSVKESEISAVENVRTATDLVLTTKDVIEILQQADFNLVLLEKKSMDLPFGISSGCGYISNVAGGAAETALRMLSKDKSDDCIRQITYSGVRGYNSMREATYTVDGKEIKVAVACGLDIAEKLLNKIVNGTANYDYVEVVACEGGCIGGDAQSFDEQMTLKLRALGLWYIDSRRAARYPEACPAVAALYNAYTRLRWEKESVDPEVDLTPEVVACAPVVEEPIVEETAEEVVEEPIVEETAEEVIEEPIVEETVEEVVEEPVVEETVEEVIEEPIVEETVEEIIEEPVVEETVEEIIEEPVVEETVEEVIEEPIVEETVEEVVEEVAAAETVEEDEEDFDDEDLTEEEKRNPYYRRLSRKERRKLKRMRRFNKSSK